MEKKDNTVKDLAEERINIIKCPPLKGSVHIHNSNSGTVQKYHEIIHNPNLWHRITASNTAVACVVYISDQWFQVYDRQNNTRDFILKSITDAVHPLDWIPVNYQRGRRGRVYFLVRNCGPAILQLCQQKLLVTNPNKPEEPVRRIYFTLFLLLLLKLGFIFVQSLSFDFLCNLCCLIFW